MDPRARKADEISSTRPSFTWLTTVSRALAPCGHAHTKAPQSPTRALNYDDGEDAEHGGDRRRRYPSDRARFEDHDHPRTRAPFDYHDGDRDRGRGARRTDNARPTGGATLVLEDLPDDITERDVRPSCSL